MPAKFVPKSVRDEQNRKNIQIDNHVHTWIWNKILEDILKCGFKNLADAFAAGGGGGWLDCDWVANCIDTSPAVQSALDNYLIDAITNTTWVQNALTDFIENNDFTLNGLWTFDNDVVFNDQVDFNNGPVNFSNLDINYDTVISNYTDSTSNYVNSNINLDGTSSFTNDWDTFLNGNTTIDNLTVNNITVWAWFDAGDLISTDAGNIITTGTDGLLYATWGGGGSFTCADVADCIDNDAAVQTALENFIENGNFDTVGDWSFSGNTTFDWPATFNGWLTIWWGSVVVNVASDSDSQTYNGTDLTWVLPSTPMTLDVLHITTDSGTNLIRGVDYSLAGDTITWINNPNNGEWLYARWLTTGSLTTAGSNVAHIERFVSTPWQTTYTLANTPVSPAFIWVSNGSGQYVKQNASDDYTVSGNDIIFNTGQTVGTVITIQYIQSIVNTANLVPMQKKTYSWAAGAWASTVTFVDVDIVSDSIITGWTITSGTQIGFWEFDLSTPWSITINSTASETGTINFTYAYII